MEDQQDIKKMIKEYIKIDDDLSQINQQIKVVRKSRNELEEKIKDYMIANSIAKVDIGTGNLRISKTKPYKKINKKIIMDVLLQSLEEDKAHNIIEDIFNDEDDDEVTKLERSKKNKKN